MPKAPEKPLLEIVTNQILDPKNHPEEFSDLTRQGIEQAKTWIEKRARRIISRRQAFTIENEPLEDLAGFMLTDNEDHYFVIGQNWPPSIRIATIFHLLGHIANDSAYTNNPYPTMDGVAITYEYMNRRKLNSHLLNGEFAVDDLISRTVLKNPRIADNNSVAKALYRSYLPFTQAHPK